MKKEQGMEYNLEIGDWVRLKDEDDSFHIISIANSSGFIKVEDISGHAFVTEQSLVTKKLTNEEIYGFESTTADEFNKDIDLGASIVKSNEEVEGVFMSGGKVEHVDYVNEYSRFGDDEEDKEK